MKYDSNMSLMKITIVYMSNSNVFIFISKTSFSVWRSTSYTRESKALLSIHNYSVINSRKVWLGWGSLRWWLWRSAGGSWAGWWGDVKQTAICGSPFCGPSTTIGPTAGVPGIRGSPIRGSGRYGTGSEPGRGGLATTNVENYKHKHIISYNTHRFMILSIHTKVKNAITRMARVVVMSFQCQ